MTKVMKNPKAVMLFAAGLGTRMKGLTADRPKPMIPVAGKALIDRSLDIIAAAGVGHIVVNLHYKAEMLRAHLADRSVTFSDESGGLLETGGGLRRALPLLGPGPVYTFNPDAVWNGPNPLTLLADAWDPVHMDALLLLIPPEVARAHSGDGDFMTGPDGRLSRGPGYIYSGAQILCTDLLEEFGETAFSLNLLWDRILERSRMFGLIYDGTWCDVGHPEGIAAAEAMLKEAPDV